MSEALSSSSATPLVTVLLSSHNGEKYLRQALDSMAAQTFTDWEWVLVDNASTDGTGSIMDDYAETQSGRIRVVHNPVKLDLADSLNVGLAVARGRYVARMDDDDVAHPERLQRQVGELEADSRLMLLGTQAYRVDEVTGLADDFTWYLDPVRLRLCLCWYNPFMHASVMYRRLNGAGQPVAYPTRYSFAEDYGLWAELVSAGRTKIMKDRLMTYRKRAGSMTGSGRTLQLESSHKVSEWYTRALFKDTPFAQATPDDIRAWIEDVEFPSAERIAVVMQLFAGAGRTLWATRREAQAGFLQWAVPFLDRFKVPALFQPQPLRLLLACGGRAPRYVAHRLLNRESGVS